jgi:hypothetical protein
MGHTQNRPASCGTGLKAHVKESFGRWAVTKHYASGVLVRRGNDEQQTLNIPSSFLPNLYLSEAAPPFSSAERDAGDLPLRGL